MGSKKKPNIVLYTVLMIVIFFAITELIIWGYGGKLLGNTIANYPQGSLVVDEAILASLVLIVMLLFKNSYVFTQKREKFTKGLFYGLFYIIGAILFILINGVINGGLKGGLSIINIFIGCFFVGVAEEFLCRGWLLNEFLERFGNTKKGIWYSIVISGIIFGLLHLGNIYTLGQDIPTTITQVIAAAATGIIFGIIYYKTKNIWTLIALHGLWDFSLFLSYISPVTMTTEVVSSFTIIGGFFTILMVGAELLNMIPYLKDIDAKPKKSLVITCAIIGIILFIAFTAISATATTTYGKDYKFDSITLEKYSIIMDNYDDYYIDYSNSLINESYSFKLSKTNNNNLVLTNTITNHYIEFKCESLVDYTIMEENDYYILAYIDYTDSANPFLNYVYINKSELSNDDKFINNLEGRIKKYLLSEKSELLFINDRANNKSYLGAYNSDYGYYLLVSEDKMAILNRD